ncbi:hypothetical protein PB1_02550 [Bacillus methanolicus PB1]|uniref:Uncharacterized protein n=1 Tax=Bacillus methanolicus PB1 TaxID=997296 RepID=I3E5L2_BACMT|nr:hypothetical protein [Bacillus methanolicus]EIJ81783.1 hypothetical protein PB1_02550 [Bacillus methanolicus PB1]
MNKVINFSINTDVAYRLLETRRQKLAFILPFIFFSVFITAILDTALFFMPFHNPLQGLICYLIYPPLMFMFGLLYYKNYKNIYIKRDKMKINTLPLGIGYCVIGFLVGSAIYLISGQIVFLLIFTVIAASGTFIWMNCQEFIHRMEEEIWAEKNK